jgi:hypothetical protein
MFDHLQNLTDAESILHYRVNFAGEEIREFMLEPEGIMSFKRGRHPDGVMADDILRDPMVSLDLSQIEKITKIFLEEIMSMPKAGGFLHLVGTPQDESDLFSILQATPRFNCAEYPAIINRETKEVLWPEMYSYDWLIEHELLTGKKAFLKEFQCRPVREVSSYLDQGEVDAVINPNLVEWDWVTPMKEHDYYMGLDLGKRSHPSHLTVFRSDKGKLIQVVSRWFDRTDYSEQLESIKLINEKLSLAGFDYDDTRAELEGFRERGELPLVARGIAFTVKNKHEMASLFGRRIRKKQIELLPDPRQKKHLLVVDDNLDAPSLPDGHGDSFFSNCLACKAADVPEKQTYVGIVTSDEMGVLDEVPMITIGADLL